MLSTDVAVLERIVLKEILMENWGSVLVGDDRRLEAALKLRDLQWLHGGLERCPFVILSTKTRAARDALPGMWGYDVLLSQNSAVSEGSILLKIRTSRERSGSFSTKIEDVKEEDVSTRRECEDSE